MMHQFPQGNPTLPDHERNPFGDSSAALALPADPWQWAIVERSRYSMQFESIREVIYSMRTH